MKLNVKLIFENLNKNAIESLKSKVISIVNNAFEDPKKSLAGDHDLIIVLKGPNEDKNKAASFINEYFRLFSGEEITKISGNDLTIQKQKDNIQYSIQYQMNWFKNLKENMKINNTEQVLTEADTSFNISPGELLGKLHQAAMKEVESKFGKGVGLTNSAIDINKNPPVGTTEEGEYSIQIRLQDESDKKEAQKKTREILQTYVSQFAGPDVAKTLAKPKWYQILRKDKVGKDTDAAGELAGFSVHYHIGIAQANPEASTKSYWDKFKDTIKGVKNKVNNSKLLQSASKIVGNFKEFAKKKYDKSSLKTMVDNFKRNQNLKKKMKEAMEKQNSEIKQIKDEILNDMFNQVFEKVKDKLSHEDWTFALSEADIGAMIVAGLQPHAKTLVKNLKQPDKNKQQLEKDYDTIANEIFEEIKNKAVQKANEAFMFTFEGCQSIIVEKQQMLSRINLITESINGNKYTLIEEGLLDNIKNNIKERSNAKKAEKEKKKAEKEHQKKIGFTVSTATLIGKLHKAASNSFQKKYGKKCLIINTAINEDANPPQCKGNGTYKITVKQLKPGLFGNTSVAKKAIYLYLTTFAGEDVAKSCLKSPFYMLKSKLEKGKQTDNAGKVKGYTVYYDLKVDFSGTSDQINESFIISFKNSNSVLVECNKQLRNIKNMKILKESKTDLNSNYVDTEKIVSNVMSDNFDIATSTLEQVLSRKVEERIKSVLND